MYTHIQVAMHSCARSLYIDIDIYIYIYIYIYTDALAVLLVHVGLAQAHPN